MHCFASLIASLITFSLVSLAASGAHAASGRVDRLVSELKAPDWQEKLAAPGWVARFKDAESFNTMVDLISNKGINWRIRIRAIRLLGETLNPLGVPVLIQILSDPVINNDCPAIKWNTATALGNFKKDRAVSDTLIYVLQFENNNVVREAVIESLGKIGDPGAVPLLLFALEDRSFAIRLSAVQALGRIGDPQAFGPLKRIADSDADPYIRSEALSALKKLGSSRHG